MWIDEKIYHEKPSSEGRTAAEMATYSLLDELNILFRRVDHDAAMTIEVCKEIEQVLGAPICKNLFLCTANKSAFYLLMMPGGKPFKTKFLSKAIGSSRLSFGPSEFMLEYLGVTPGSVSAMGLMNDRAKKVRLVIDRELLAADEIGLHPCMNTSTISIKTSDILGRILPATGHEATIVDLPWEDAL